MLNKHRDIYAMLRLLGGNLTSMEKVELSHNSPLFANGVGEEDYLGDPYLLGKEPGLLKPPLELIPWNFVSRSIYSPGNLNPRKKLESHIKEGLDDVIRELLHCGAVHIPASYTAVQNCRSLIEISLQSKKTSGVDSLGAKNC
ncbi:hypothetical protein M8J77_007713 [Diaphorina citri]|nr:hypothetical protein M8J77_007713 [Diaphorina citri]